MVAESIEVKADGNEFALEPYKAGPMAGCRVMQNQNETRSLNIPGSMSPRVLIFVVDLAEASMTDSEERKLDEVTEDILDAFGVAAGGKRLEFIFAGYDGLIRNEIKNDKDLMAFFAVFNIAAGKKGDEIVGADAHVPGLNTQLSIKMQQKQKEIDAKERRELGATKKELSKLRLGGILTKIQMQRYIRQLTAAKKELEVKTAEIYGYTLLAEDLQNQLAAQTDKYDKLECKIPYMINDAVTEACNKLRAELEEKFELEKKKAIDETKKEMRAEAERQMKPLRQAIERLQADFKSANEKIAKQKKELEGKDREIERNHTKYAQLQEEKKQAEDELQHAKAAIANFDSAHLETEINELKDLLKQCYNLLEENGIPLPGKGRLACGANTFRWSISNFEIRAQYQKNHSCQSPEFNIDALDGRCQLEFFPGGIDSSFEGYCAVKLRLPHSKKIRIQWQLRLGELTFGPREDEFKEENWWCRCGQLLWANIVKLSDVNEQILEGSLPLSLEVLNSSYLEETEDISTQIGLHARRRKKLPEVETRSIYSAPYSTMQSRIAIHLDGEEIQDFALETFVIEYLRRRGLISGSGGVKHAPFQAFLQCETPKFYPSPPTPLGEDMASNSVFMETAPANMFQNATLRDACGRGSPKAKKSHKNAWGNQCNQPKWMGHGNSPPKKGVNGLKPLQRGFPSTPQLMSPMSTMSSMLSQASSPKNCVSPSRKSRGVGDKCAMSRIMGESQ